MYPVLRFLLAAIPAAAALLCAPCGRAADCNANGEDDLAEIAAGRASDCNRNGVPDPCDVAPSRPGLIVQSRFDLLLAAASALAIGDLDGNGRPDVITGAPGGGVGLHIYSRDASGSFLPPARVSVLTEEVTAVEAGDIDGDGDLDVAVTAAGSLRVAWVPGDGSGGFGEPALIGADSPTALVATDLDRNGHLDLAYTSANAGTVVVQWNEGSARFTELVLPDAPRPTSLAVSDFQRDGELDLVVGHEQSLTVQRGSGTRGFVLDVRLPLSASQTALLAEDMTGDGAPDIICLAQQILIFGNDGNGVFHRASTHYAGPSPKSMDRIDVDADGRPDIAVMNREAVCNQPDHSLHVARNLGNGDLAQPETFPGGPPTSGAGPTIRTADMDADGIDDVVTTAGAVAGDPGVITVLEPGTQGASADCDSNGVPDECDPDCNANTLPDACDITRLASRDADTDGVPDECQPDCNSNGIPDTFDIAGGATPDLDGSGFPDECETPAFADCNGNGVPDAAEVAQGTTPDCNRNGRPDACDLERRYVFDRLLGHSAALRETGYPAAADLDGDGVADFAVATRGACCPAAPRSGGLALFRGLGEGRFASLGERSLSGEPSGLEAADVDGDGDQDLVAANASSCGRTTDTITVYRNDGRAMLSISGSFSARGRPNRIAIADMDGNGTLDIFAETGTASGNLARIFANDGSGSFREGPQAPDTGLETWHVVPADLNGDALHDIVTAGVGPNRVQVFLAEGGLRFGAPRSIDVPRAAHVAPGDLDGDGDTDLLVLVEAQDIPLDCPVLWNDGDGGFPSRTLLDPGFRPRQASVADLDGDGREDIVALGTPPGFHSGHMTGTLGTNRSLGGGSFAGFARFSIDGLIDQGITAELDGDGHLDVLATLDVAGLGDRAFVFSNTGSGAFRTTGKVELRGIPGPIEAADLDADGSLDLAIANADGLGLGILWNEERGAFSGPEPHVLPGPVQALNAADLDGDGDLDIAAAVPFEIHLFLNAGRRPIELGPRLAHGSFTVSLAARDLDGDGDTDIVTANTIFQEFEDNVSVFENLGAGRFAAARNFVAGRRPSSMAAGDLDGDGDVDLAIRNLDPSNLSLLENGGRGTFSRRTALPVHDNAYFVLAVEADGDGDEDLVLGPGFRFLLNRVGWEFEWGPLSLDTSMNFAMGTGDLDGDSAPEVISGVDAEFMVYPNLGGGRLGDPSVPAGYPNGGGGSDSVSLEMRGIAVADLDADGQNDIAGAVEYSPSFVSVLLNRTAMTSLDTDGDGVPDECNGEPFRRGDSNGDGGVDLSDAIYILRGLFLGGEPLPCLKAADANDDSRVDVSDPVKILGTLFLGEPDLPAPSGTCGADPTGDALGCADFGGCA